MPLEELSADLKRLEHKLDSPKKDGWVKLQAISTLLGSLLVPVALGIAGFHISTTLTTQQIHSSDSQATNNVRVAQYPSDVEAGRRLGSWVVAQMRESHAFRVDLTASQSELQPYIQRTRTTPPQR